MLRPILDEMFEAIIFNDIDKFDNISDTRAEETISLRTIISTTDSSNIEIGIDLNKILKEVPFMIPLFKGPNFIFISAQTALETQAGIKKSTVIADWSFSFDSNVAEKVRGYFNNENIDLTNKQRVITLLSLKKKHSIRIDLLPFLIENIRFAREDESNLRPLNTIAAFKAIDYLNWEEFEKDPNNPVLIRNGKELSLNELVYESEDIYNSLLNHKEVKNIENNTLFCHVFLLEFTREYLSSKDTAKITFSRMIDFCIFELGKIPIFELSLAWQFFHKPHAIRFFGPIRGLKKTLIKDIKGMAWDLTHIRTLETIATISKKGSFFLPFFVSFDQKFSELLQDNPITIFIMDDNAKSMLSARENEKEFQYILNELISEKAKKAISPEQRELRRKNNLDIKNLDMLRKKIENEVSILADKACNK